MDGTEEGIKGTAFEIIQKVSGLKWESDNIYTDKEGIKYFLDKYGFHATLVVYSIHEINDRRRTLDCEIARYKKAVGVETELNKTGIKKIKKLLELYEHNPVLFLERVKLYMATRLRQPPDKTSTYT